MSMMEVAKVQVATVVSESQLAFNGGRDVGIQEGDIVLLNRKVEVIDPVTKERLGTVLLPKLRLRVNLISDRYCVAVVTDRVEARTASLMGKAVASSQPLKTITIKTQESDMRGVVLVEIGETAVVRRSEGDEPPF